MISVVICTKNEEKNIKRCLQSVTRIADEIIVVDSFSTDQTPQICQSFPNLKFYQTEWLGFSQTKNKANLLATHNYILSLDADEELSSELQEEILQAKNNLTGVYRINRLSNYCGRWIYHSGWFPDRHVRLFPRNRTHWEGDYVHEKLNYEASLPVSDFKHLVYHYSVVNFQDHLQKVRKYSLLGANKMATSKNIGTLLVSLLLNPPFRFLRHYFLKLGILDGTSGLLISVISAYSVFLKYYQAIKIKLS